MNRRLVIFCTVAGLSALSHAGCERHDEITRYTVPKPHVLFAANHVEREETDRRDIQGSGPAAKATPLPAFEVPEGWVEAPGEAVGITKAVFYVKQGDQKAKITVTDLAAGAAELLPNVNRWRRQVGLERSITEQELDREVKQIKVDGAVGHYAEIVGAETPEGRQSILGVIVVHDATAWFFKLMGDAELAKREKERFEAFVQSVTFQTSRGVGDGK